MVDFELGKIEVGVPGADVGDDGFYFLAVAATVTVEKQSIDRDVTAAGQREVWRAVCRRSGVNSFLLGKDLLLKMILYLCLPRSVHSHR